MRVLLVDDEEEFVSTLAERLELRGITAEAVTSGFEALERVAETEYQVVVLDLKMAGIGGLDTLRRIRQLRPGSAFIILTGHTGLDEFQKVQEEGVSFHLMKPLDIEVLIEKIRTAGGGKAEP